MQGDYWRFSQLVLDGHSAGGSGFGVTVEGDDVALMDNNITSRAAASCLNVGNQGTAAQRAYRLVLLRNRIHNCRSGVRIRAATNTAVLNNLIYDNIDRGVRLETDAFSSYVWRNVIDGNGEGVLLGGRLGRRASTSNAIHANVISYSNSRWNVSSSFDAGQRRRLQPRLEQLPVRDQPGRLVQHRRTASSGRRAPAASTRYRQTLGEPQYADRDAARLPPCGRQPVPRHER